MGKVIIGFDFYLRGCNREGSTGIFDIPYEHSFTLTYTAECKGYVTYNF